MPAMRLLAKARGVRGSWLDPFGHTAERRLERQLARDYAATIDELLGTLDAGNRALALAIAQGPERMRGYGHVKLANVATARAREQELLERWRGGAGAPRTIPIVAASSP
jgi:indolepyruvate ferredoxin oxidoreductase